MKKISKADLPIKELVELIKEDFIKTDKLIKNQITSEVDRIPELSNHIISLGGKRLRPILTIACAKMLNTENNHHIALAAAVELLHTATLVHDDVVDESELRRGTRSVNQVWTNSYSVLMGDFIYSKAFILMVKLGIPAVLDELAKATNDIARGEIIQLELFEKKQLIELKDLLKVSYLKTGRLFEASAKTGAMLACRSAEEIKTFDPWDIPLINTLIFFFIFNPKLKFSLFCLLKVK